MSADELRYEIEGKIEDVSFIYNGKTSGIIPKFDRLPHKFFMWYGDKEKEYSNIDELMADKFFDGKSLEEIAEIVTYA